MCLLGGVCHWMTGSQEGWGQHCLQAVLPACCCCALELAVAPRVLGTRTAVAKVMGTARAARGPGSWARLQVIRRASCRRGRSVEVRRRDRALALVPARTLWLAHGNGARCSAARLHPCGLPGRLQRRHHNQHVRA